MESGLTELDLGWMDFGSAPGNPGGETEAGLEPVVLSRAKETLQLSGLCKYPKLVLQVVASKGTQVSYTPR